MKRVLSGMILTLAMCSMASAQYTPQEVDAAEAQLIDDLQMVTAYYSGMVNAQGAWTEGASPFYNDVRGEFLLLDRGVDPMEYDAIQMLLLDSAAALQQARDDQKEAIDYLTSGRDKEAAGDLDGAYEDYYTGSTYAWSAAYYCDYECSGIPILHPWYVWGGPTNEANARVFLYPK